MHVIKKAFASLPVAVLVIAVGVGLASAAFQDDEPEGRDAREPGIENFIDESGEVDIAGYLAASAAFDASPPVVRGEPIEARIFGCAMDSEVLVELVPRVDPLTDLELEEVRNFLEEPVTLFEGTVDEEVPTVDITLPDDPLPPEVDADSAEAEESEGVTPLGFATIRVSCTDADGEDAEYETIIDVLDTDNLFEFTDEDIVTVLDIGDVEA